MSDVAMMSRKSIPIGDALVKRAGTVDPSKHPGEIFDLYSIPAYDRGTPDLLPGSEIGSSKQIVQPGDVLLSRIVPHIRRAWVVGQNNGRRLIASGEWMVFRSTDIDPGWLRHLLLSDRFHREFMTTVAGVGGSLLRARPTHVAQIEIPQLPLDEQRRIAGTLDCANGLSERRSRAAAKIDELQLAVFSESFGDPIRNQKLWKTMELGELGEWRSGGTPPRAQKHYFRGDTPWYSSGELGPLFTIGSAESVSAEAFRETSIKPVPAGALMLGMYDTAAFKSSIASTNCACNQAIAFSKLDPNLVDPVYVYFAIKLASERLRQLQRGIRQKNLNLSIVRSIRIPAPPLELQTDFSKQIAAIGRYSDRMESSAKQIRLLAGALQSRSFSGQL